MLPVYVSAPSVDCPAHWALQAEGVDHVVVGHELGYARQLAVWWRTGVGFVLVEHDVAPWPGAVQQLADCPRDWCAFRFPKFQRLIRSLGCVKFSTRLVATYPELPESWEDRPFADLEGPMLSAVANVLRAEDPDRFPVCEHQPPVAHIHLGVR